MEPCRLSRLSNRAAATLALMSGAAMPVMAQEDHPVILQAFEQPWRWLEHRMPDIFLAGYGATWLPPVARPSDPTSPGYDVFDRFDLGRPGAPTAYGTEQGFRTLVREFHHANVLVYVDIIMNHNSARSENQAFHAAGGWPGFWAQPPGRGLHPTDPWGDFHNGVASGDFQSDNPGGPLYDRIRGDLVALCDINHATNHQFIRHPVEPGDPLNIPPGTVRNQPSPANARLYPDTALAPKAVVNPPFRGQPQRTFSFHPYNTADPMAGDRSPTMPPAAHAVTQCCSTSSASDGFRLDAAKHIDTFFWDGFWDAVVFERRHTRRPLGHTVLLR